MSTDCTGLDRYTFTAAADVPAHPEDRTSFLWPDRPQSPRPNALVPPDVWKEVQQRAAARGHASRVETAGFYHRAVVTLDAQRCTFGTRRVTLAGELTAQSAAETSALVLALLEWTLTQVYGADSDPDHHTALTGVRVSYRQQRRRRRP